MQQQQQLFPGFGDPAMFPPDMQFPLDPNMPFPQPGMVFPQELGTPQPYAQDPNLITQVGEYCSAVVLSPLSQGKNFNSLAPRFE